jgi:hypothetical protein
MSRKASVRSSRALDTSIETAPTLGPRERIRYRGVIVGVRQFWMVVGVLLIGAIALGACGGDQSVSAGQKTVEQQQAVQAQKAKQKETVGNTVVGMHYAQMASSVDPLMSQLSTELSAGRAIPNQQVKMVLAGLKQFDVAVLRLRVPSDLRGKLADLRTTNERLVDDLTSIQNAKSVTTQQEEAARTALQRQRAAATALSTALGLPASTH